MKIVIDTPGKHDLVQVLVNHELVAFSPPGTNELKVKKIGCNFCGECCLDMPPDHTEFGADDEGKCNALNKEGDKWLCTAGSRKPFKCLSDPIDPDLNCSIRYF